MPGRTRRVRYLVLALFLGTVYLLYQRNPQRVEQYADYIEGAVGGGAVLRLSETKTTDHRNQQPDSTSQAAAFTTTRNPELGDGALFPVETSSKAYGVEATSSSTSPVEPGFTTPLVPALTDNLKPDGQIDPGSDDTGAPASPHSSIVHWVKRDERYAISSTIQLPTGSPQPIPLIQKRGAGSADLERLAAIKEAAKHAWNGYREIGWGYDEVQPLSGLPKNTFNGWGATLVDSLDTLWIMGMKAEFEEAVQQVKKIDFTTSPREDIPLFEVTIRYLGGMIAAYDVSGHKYEILLDKALELAEILYSAFDTPNRMPKTFYHWKPDAVDTDPRAGRRIVMAELGTLSVEFTRLTQLTGEAKFYDAIARITDEFEVWQNNTRVPGMWPLIVDASGCKRPAQVYSPNLRNQQIPVPGGNGAMMTSADPVKAGEKPASGPGSTGEKSANGPSDTTGIRNPAGTHSYPVEIDNPGDTGLMPEIDKDLAPEEKMRLIPLAKDPKDPTTNLYKRQLDEPIVPRPDTVPDVATPPAPAQPSSSENDASEEVCLPQGFAAPSLNAPQTFGLGGASDSTYEYLPKEWLLLGGRSDQYKDMYLASMKTIADQLLFRPMTPDQLDILISGELHAAVNMTTGEIVTRLDPKQEHLTCFVGGMFAMGGKIFEVPEHVELGRRATEGCIWSYNSTASGIMPETFFASPCSSTKSCAWNQTQYWEELDPYEKIRLSPPDPQDDPREQLVRAAVEANSASSKASSKSETAPAQGLSNEKMAKDQAATSNLNKRDAETGGTFAELDRAQAQGLQPAPPVGQTSSTAANVVPAGTQVQKELTYSANTPLSHEDFVKKKIKDERLPAGFTRIDGKKYILRPEAIESVFYMYRITGEQYWRDAGWKMFTAIDRATRTTYGHSMVDDVTKTTPAVRDQMESFWLAETLKYFYLLYDDPQTWSLDDWVLNTEAHFFKRPENPTATAAGRAAQEIER